MDATYDGRDGPIDAVAQRAVDATSTAYTDDAGVDVEQALRSALAESGVTEVDDAWVAEVATGIRSGHGVRIDDTVPQETSGAGRHR